MAMASNPLADAPELCLLGVVALTRRYADKSLSPVEVAEAALRRARDVQDRYNAFTLIDGEAAMGQARAAEARWLAGAPASPIDGVPSTIKDIVWVEGRTIRYGSRTTPVTPPHDAPAIARLRSAGAVMLGLTTTPEFGWKAVTDSPYSGVTTNPWNSSLTPGGSSGGAAVAAATGAGVLHLGTDGGGSIRIPSSFTGIFGIKPSYGRVPAFPPSPFGTVAHLGPMTRSVDDAAAMLAVMAGRDRLDWTQPPGDLPSLERPPFSFAGKRIGYWSAPPRGPLDGEVQATVDGAVERLQQAGAVIEEIALPDHDRLFDLFAAHWLTGAAARVALLAADERDLVDPGLASAAAAGAAYDVVTYLRATQDRVGFGRAMDALLERYDLVVSPATAIPAFAAGQELPPGSGLGRWTEWAGFSYPINLSQQPACSTPCGFTADGRPIGFQIIGPRGADSVVLAAASAFAALD
jgi:amidase/aspartyl-tRNA(Asn)/glutamyl-tRNA(Gln) amidotransferase subunit A